jgi:hypothetical protein
VVAPGYAMLLSLHYCDVARWLAVGVALLGVGKEFRVNTETRRTPIGGHDR